VRTEHCLRIVTISILACLLLPSLISLDADAAGEEIRLDDYFEYKIHETLKDCKGAYYGYSENTRGTGRYEVIDISGDEVTVQYEWEWEYESDTDPSDSDRRTDRIIFNKKTRMYVDGFDLDEPISGEKAIWFWIDPDVREGDVVKILDKYFEVTDRSATVWSNWLPRVAIELSYKGRGSRDDSYGTYTTRINDRYYFDPESGYIIAERYEAPHSGRYEGESASFKWKFNFDATDSSYNRRIDYGVFFFYIFAIPAMTAAAIYGIYNHFRWIPKRTPHEKYKGLQVRRIREIEVLPPISDEIASTYFAPFIEDMVTKALVAKDRVVIASNVGTILGIAIYHRDAKVGSVFAMDSGVAEHLRRYVGAKDFFSETRHKAGKKNKGEYIYNIYETHKVFIRDKIEPEPYDRDLISQVTPGDIPEICAISKKAYKIRGRRWFETLVSEGDVGIVAKVDGLVVGFAFATIVDDHARLHSLTVDPQYRGRGIGKELMRARLTMIYHLGVQDAILEIADWNLPSLRISTSFGFTERGKMYVETIKTKRIKRNIVRR
jgi:[ribosomal protein S18]-alanine N-acetyltransferase